MTQTRARVLIVGSGLAGLACACRLAERRCADVVLVEQADSLGGTTRLSQGWIWTYRSEALRRRHAPDADPVAARLVADSWAGAVARLSNWNIPLLATTSPNPLTDAVRVDPAQLLDMLAADCLAAGVEIQTGRALATLELADAGITARCADGTDALFDEVVLAGGGHAAANRWVSDELAAAWPATTGVAPGWYARHAGRSTGSTQAAAADGAHAALGWEASGSAVLFARLLADVPDPGAADFVESAVVPAPAGVLIAAPEPDGAPRRIAHQPHHWSDSIRANALAAAGGSGVLVFARSERTAPTPYGLIEDVVVRMRERGAAVRESGPQVLEYAAHAGVADPWCVVPVVAAATHTTRGLRIDADARVLSADGEPVLGGHLRAVGVDVGGVAGGGYTSGLAQALVTGIRAAESIRPAVKTG